MGLERLLAPLSDIDTDGNGTDEGIPSSIDSLAHDAALVNLRALFLGSSSSKSDSVPETKPEAQPERDPIIVMKDNIFWAREQIRYAIDALIKLDANVAMVHQNPHIPNSAPQLLPLISLGISAKPPPLSIPAQIDNIRLILASKKMHLMDASNTLQTASARLDATITNETRFYGDVAVDQLRRHNWILHSDLGRWGRALYVDYGLKFAGSYSQEMCQAFFTWKSSAASSSGDSTKHNKITLKYQHGCPRSVHVSFLANGKTVSSSFRVLPDAATFLSHVGGDAGVKYSKIQKALDSAKAAAFETELFREISHAATHAHDIPGIVHLTALAISIQPPLSENAWTGGDHSDSKTAVDTNGLSQESNSNDARLEHVFRIDFVDSRHQGSSTSKAPLKHESTQADEIMSENLQEPRRSSKSDADAAFVAWMLHRNLRRMQRFHLDLELNLNGARKWRDEYVKSETSSANPSPGQRASAPAAVDHPAKLLQPVLLWVHFLEVVRSVGDALFDVCDEYEDGRVRKLGGVLAALEVRKSLVAGANALSSSIAVEWSVMGVGRFDGAEIPASIMELGHLEVLMLNELGFKGALGVELRQFLKTLKRFSLRDNQLFIRGGGRFKWSHNENEKATT
ncbi:hypothetical protein HDU81_000603 [Chytriomyces hyalinus]|nr:hypothetical protein HDU81_000603 [Chytriomyces hyalinus]